MDEFDALWAFLVAAVVAFVATPPTARLARRLGVLNQPRDRDLHDHDVPGLGGLAILVGRAGGGGCSSCPDDRETRGILAGRGGHRAGRRAGRLRARAGCRRW